MPETKEKPEITIDLNPTPPAPNDPVWVIIESDVKGKISVRPDPFWLDTNEHVEFFCNLPHAKHGGDCFTVKFLPDRNKKPLFGSADTFRGHRRATPTPHPDATKGIPYKYQIEIGNTIIDPQGGVKP